MTLAATSPNAKVDTSRKQPESCEPASSIINNNINIKKDALEKKGSGMCLSRCATLVEK